MTVGTQATCEKDYQRMVAEATALIDEKRRFAHLFEATVAAAVGDEQIRQIVIGIRKIQVPPPILPLDASIGIGQLAPNDVASRKVFLGEAGVGVAHIVGTIAGTSIPVIKLIVAAGSTIIAAENAADVYAVKQNAVYEKALAYLKDEKQRAAFTATVRALREHRTLSENANVEMVRTAQAILDPALGNSSIRIAWNAMLSPDARNAAMTQAAIEVSAHVMGQLAGAAFERIQSVQSPAFLAAEDFLEKGTVALRTVEDPAAKASLAIAMDQANNIIANTYRTIRPWKAGLEEIESMYAKRSTEEYLTKKP